MAQVRVSGPDAKSVHQTDRSGQAEDATGPFRCSMRPLAQRLKDESQSF